VSALEKGTRGPMRKTEGGGSIYEVEIGLDLEKEWRGMVVGGKRKGGQHPWAQIGVQLKS